MGVNFSVFPRSIAYPHFSCEQLLAAREQRQGTVQQIKRTPINFPGKKIKKDKEDTLKFPWQEDKKEDKEDTHKFPWQENGCPFCVVCNDSEGEQKKATIFSPVEKFMGVLFFSVLLLLNEQFHKARKKVQVLRR